MNSRAPDGRAAKASNRSICERLTRRGQAFPLRNLFGVFVPVPDSQCLFSVRSALIGSLGEGGPPWRLLRVSMSWPLQHSQRPAPLSPYRPRQCPPSLPSAASRPVWSTPTDIPVNLFDDILNIPSTEVQGFGVLSDSLLFSGDWWVPSATNLWGTDPGDLGHYMGLLDMLIPFPADLRARPA